MLCLSMTAMLVGKDNPVVTNSILRLFLLLLIHKKWEMLILAICNIIIKYKITSNDDDYYHDKYNKWYKQ